MTPNFVIMGLPASGKTTFLAALWHLIEADETACRLRLDRYEGDLKYLNEIAQAWRTFQKVPRTSHHGDVDVIMHLVDSDTGRKARAFFPDLAGEAFDTQVELRRCRPGFIANVQKDDGVLLFISVDSKQDTLSVVELNSMLPEPEPSEEIADKPALPEEHETDAAEIHTGEPVLTGDEADDDEFVQPEKPSEWQPKMIPAQVRIAQMLMDVLRPPFLPRRRKLAVILSAWDLVEASGMTPEAWLQANMPLVDQVLRTNRNSFDAAIYGVSAQGVSLEDKAGVRKAAGLLPSKRITIIRSGVTSHDITTPLVWLMTRD